MRVRDEKLVDCAIQMCQQGYLLKEIAFYVKKDKTTVQKWLKAKNMRTAKQVFPKAPTPREKRIYLAKKEKDEDSDLTKVIRALKRVLLADKWKKCRRLALQESIKHYESLLGVE